MPDEITTLEQHDELVQNPDKLHAHIAEVVEEQLKGFGDTLGASLGKQIEEALRRQAPSGRVPMDDSAAKGAATQRPMVGNSPDGDFREVTPDQDPWRKMGLLRRGNARQYLYNPRSPAAKAYSGEFKHLGEFLCAADYMRQPTQNNLLKALGEGGGAEGSFLVPEEQRSELMMLAVEDAIVRPRSMIRPMTRESQTFPVVKETTRASNLFGGVKAFWNPEAGDISADESEPAFGQARYVAHKLTGYTVASRELLDDSAIALEGVLMPMFGTALGYFEDIAFIEGTGAGQPLGILNSPCLISVTKETGQDAATIVKENLDKMLSRMLPESRGRAVWLMHQDTMPQLLSLSQSVGTGGNSVMVMNIQNAPTFTIYGRPVIFTEKCQTLGTVGDIYFADFGYYTIGDRMALEMSSSPHVKFITDQMVWKFVQRVDGRPWLTSALTPRNGSTTISPFVALATRA